MIGIGAGIAIAGIWMGVGIVGLKDGEAACVVGFFAILATFFVVVLGG